MPTQASQFWFSGVRILSQPSQQGREGRERLFLEATSAKLLDVMQKAGLPLKQYKGNNSTACGAGTVLVTLNSSHTYNSIYTNVNTTLKQTKEKRRLGVSDLHKATELVRIPQSSLLKCMAGRAGMALRTVSSKWMLNHVHRYGDWGAGSWRGGGWAVASRCCVQTHREATNVQLPGQSGQKRGSTVSRATLF